MKQLAESRARPLIEHEAYPCVSLYLPIHVPGGDIREDAIRLKNLLTACQNRLQEELPHKAVHDVLKPGFDLLSTDKLWTSQSRGLGLFLAPSFFETCHLSHEPEQASAIGHFFNLLPLLGSLTDRTYYLLVLSQKDVKLLKFNGHRPETVSLGDLPKTIDEFLKYDVGQEHVQAHTRPLGKSVGTDAQFHGQGNVADNARWKKNVERYIKQVVKHVDKQLYGQHAPLILAGVDFEQAIFREYSGYRFLTEDGISSKTGQFEMDELQRRAQDVVQSFYNRDVEERIARFHNQIDTGLTGTDLEEILPAAHAGRIDTLLVDTRRQQFGTFDAASHAVTIHADPQPGDENLFNLAAVYALRSDAAVYALEARKLDGDAPAGAIYRY